MEKYANEEHQKYTLQKQYNINKIFFPYNKFQSNLCKRVKRFIRGSGCCCRRPPKPKCGCCRRFCQINSQSNINSCGSNLYQSHQQQFIGSHSYFPLEKTTEHSISRGNQQQLPEMINFHNYKSLPVAHQNIQVQPSNYNKEYSYQTPSKDSIVSSYFDEILNNSAEQIVPLKITSTIENVPSSNYQSPVNVSANQDFEGKQF